jgi:glycosyltransferase involved in cell wall biosynthesis
MDNRGGASQVAWNLRKSYLGRGLNARMAVGRKFGDDQTIAVIPNEEARSLYSRSLLKLAGQLNSLPARSGEISVMNKILSFLAEPRRWLNVLRGMEDFSYPGTYRLFDLFPEAVDIIHCHNLHGDYFDLRALSWLSRKVPVVLTLHDAWLLSGHCAHSFDCERWKTGCGQCPDLTIIPEIKRDATAFNWQRKRDIYDGSRLFVATPSQWLMDKVNQSMLATAVVEGRVIPNGVDLSVFQGADRHAVRAALSLPLNARVLLFTAHGIRPNVWKDYETMKAATVLVAEHLPGQDVRFIALGEDAPAERAGPAEIHFVPYQEDPHLVARYYQAADIYLHAARADTFPSTILEALACGTPVVATAVGGIPEQVKPLAGPQESMDYKTYGPDQATGFLVPPGNAKAMAEATVALLTDERLHRRLAENAARDARARFAMDRQVEDYLELYEVMSSCF